MNAPERRSLPVSTIAAAWLILYYVCKLARSSAEAFLAPVMQFALYPIGFLLAAAFFFGSKTLTKADRLFAPLFSLWFIASCVLRSRTFLPDYIESGEIIFLYCGTVYWFGCSLARAEFPKISASVLHAVCAATAILFLIPILSGIAGALYANDPSRFSSLFFEGRLSLLGTHPNTTGSLSAVGLILCAFLFLRSSGARRLVPAAEGLLFFLCLAMTDSKQNQFGLATCAGLAVFFPLLAASGRRPLRIFFAASALIAAAALTYGSIHLTATAVSRLSAGITQAGSIPAEGSSGSVFSGEQGSSSATGSSGDGTGSAAQAKTPGTPETGSPENGEGIRVRSAGDFHTLTSRTRLWKHWLSLLKKLPTAWLYGTEAVPENMEEAGYSPHNAFIVLLVCFGLPSLIMMVWFLIRILGPSIRLCLSPESRGQRLFPIGCFMLLLNACMESDFFYSISIENFLFFLLAGLTVGADRILSEKQFPV